MLGKADWWATRSAGEVLKDVMRYLRWWAGYAYSRTVVMVLVWGLGSLLALPFAASRGWEVVGVFLLALAASTFIVVLPAIRWRLRGRLGTTAQVGDHRRETPPWA